MRRSARDLASIGFVRDTAGRFALRLAVDEEIFVLVDLHGRRWPGGIGFSPAWCAVDLDKMPPSILAQLITAAWPGATNAEKKAIALAIRTTDYEPVDGWTEHDFLLHDFEVALSGFVLGGRGPLPLVRSVEEASSLLCALRLRLHGCKR